jgi:hypothetical protein
MVHDQPSHEDAWQPATSRPGELYTVEGRSRAAWAVLSGLRNRDPRGRAYRRQMFRVGLLFLALVAVIVVIAAIV